jgi:uncharacterized membrane protein
MTVKCEICGIHNAKYVCQNCGSRVCTSCFDPSLELCIKCAEKSPTEEGLKYGAGFKVMVLGFILSFLGILVMIISAIFSGELSGLSFVILLLPIPIGVVAGPYGGILLILALVLTAIFITILILTGRRYLKQHPPEGLAKGV